MANALQDIQLDDIRPYAQTTKTQREDLLIVEKLSEVDLSQVAIQTSFFTIAVCTDGKAQFMLNGVPCQVQAATSSSLLADKPSTTLSEAKTFKVLHSSKVKSLCKNRL